MPSSCFCPGCFTGCNKIESKISLYSVPKDIEYFNKWKRAIPRADRELQKTSKVCALHFTKEMIINKYYFTINGEVQTLDRGVSKLAKNAVPCIFPNLPSYFTKIPKIRKSPKIRVTTQKKKILNRPIPGSLHNSTKETLNLAINEKMVKDNVVNDNYIPVDLNNSANETVNLVTNEKKVNDNVLFVNDSYIPVGLSNSTKSIENLVINEKKVKDNVLFINDNHIPDDLNNSTKGTENFVLNLKQVKHNVLDFNQSQDMVIDIKHENDNDIYLNNYNEGTENIVKIVDFTNSTEDSEKTVYLNQEIDNKIDHNNASEGNEIIVNTVDCDISTEDTENIVTKVKRENLESTAPSVKSFKSIQCEGIKTTDFVGHSVKCCKILIIPETAVLENCLLLKSCKACSKLTEEIADIKHVKRSISQLKRNQKRKDIAIKNKLKALKTENELNCMKNLSNLQQLVIKHFIKASKAKGKKIVYDKEWLQQCIAIRKISPELYIYLRINNILPLPTINLLNRKLRKIREEQKQDCEKSAENLSV